MSEQEFQIEKETMEINTIITTNQAPVFRDRIKEEQPLETMVPMKEDRMLSKRTADGFKLRSDYRSVSLIDIRNAMDQGDYTLVGRTFRGKRTRTKKENKHSKDYMAPLIDSIDELERLQLKKISPDKVDEEIENMQNLYLQIFEKAFQYCQNRHSSFKEGKARKDMVMLIRDQANEERMKLANNARAIADMVKSDQSKTFTYADVVRTIRTRTLRVGEGGVESITTGGKGTSDLYVVNMKDGDALYIRASENLKDDKAGCSAFMEDTVRENKEYQEKLANQLNDHDLEEKERLSIEKELASAKEDLVLQEKMLRDLKLVKPQNERAVEIGMIKLFFSAATDTVDVFKEWLEKDDVFKTGNGEIARYLEEAKKEEAWLTYREKAKPLLKKTMYFEDELKRNPRLKLSKEAEKVYKELNELKKEFAQKDTKIARLRRALKATGKHINQRDFARNVARIPNGANVSKRNVAASILARALGIRDLVAESEMVELEIDGKKIKGTLMEKAPGDDLMKEVDRLWGTRPVVYSAKVIRDLNILHLFDILCGQIDRKTDNYMSVLQSIKYNQVVTSIKAIDNDMSFGTLSYDEIVSKSTKGKANYYQQLPAITNKRGNLLVDALDKEFCDKLKNFSPAYVDFLLMGILSREERHYIKLRLQSLQMIIMKTYANKKTRKVFKNGDKAWAAYKREADMYGFPENSYYLAECQDKNRKPVNPDDIKHSDSVGSDGSKSEESEEE